MANWTLVLPYRHDEADLWRELGLTDLPAQASAAVTADQVRHVLREQGWPLTEVAVEADGAVSTHFSCRRREDGAWPPFSEIEVEPTHLSVRHGGYACWLIARAASATCGPLVAWDEGGAGPVLCTPTTTYEEFAHAFGHAGDAARDAAWSVPDER